MPPPLWQKMNRNWRASWSKWKRRVKNQLKTQHSKIKIMASSPIISWQTGGETMATVTYFIFLGSKITVNGDCSHEIKRRLLLGRKVMTSLDSILKSRDTALLAKLHLVKFVFFSSSLVWMWVLDSKESWMLRNWCFWTVVSEKTLESPLDYKEIKPVNLKGNQPWIFIGRPEYRWLEGRCR